MKKTNMRMVPAVLLLSILCLAGVLAAAAYLSAEDNEINSFTVGNNVTEIVEEYEEPPEVKPGMEIIKKVSVKNTGKNDCYVRVLIVFSESDAERAAELDINEECWRKDEDGYYYYKKILRAGESTENLFTKVLISQDIDNEKIKGFDIYVYSESKNVESGGFS